MTKVVRLVVLVAVAMLFTHSLFAAECPPSVRTAVEKAHPGAKIAGCKEERERGRLQYEVGITTKEGKKMELDISPEGALLLTEESVPSDAVPEMVKKALAAKYPDAKEIEAEKQTAADGKVSYEIAFKVGNDRKELTFTPDGKLVEEEKNGEKDERDDDDD